jgi:hypothetical protein
MAEARDVVGYEGLYLVTSDGFIISLPREHNNYKGDCYVTKAKVLKNHETTDGYLRAALTKNGKTKLTFVHRIVAEAFLENPNSYPEVNHKDENPKNNNVENLEWCTKQYNIDYSKSKRVAQYTEDGIKIAEYKSIAYAAEITGVGRTSINNVLSGWTNTAGGYLWEYVEKGDGDLSH